MLSGGGGRKDYGLEVLAKIPGLYEVPKLRNLIFLLHSVLSGGGRRVGGERTIG